MKKFIADALTLSSGILLLFTSCKKEGENGKYSISGRVLADYYSETDGNYEGQGPAVNEDVYIIYGDQEGVGDKISTDYEGKFEFQYLSRGNYKVYVYSEDTSGKSLAENIAVVKDIKVKDDEDAGDLVITKIRNDGKLAGYGISGTVSVKFCNSEFTKCTSPYPTAGVEVFLMRKGEKMHFRTLKTSDNGFYNFEGLSNGEYVVYTITKNESYQPGINVPELLTLKETVNISGRSTGNVNFTIAD